MRDGNFKLMSHASISAQVRSCCAVLCGDGATLDATEADIEGNLGKAEALRQAILTKALAGELVPQSPADEPASALLALLRTNRESAISRPKPRPAKAT